MEQSAVNSEQLLENNAQAAEDREQSPKKHPLFHPRVGTIIGIAVIVAAVIGTLISGPHEVEHDDLFGDASSAPTVTVTGFVNQTKLAQQFMYSGVSMSFTGVAQAVNFSDDEKMTRGYTVRLYLNTTNNNNNTLGIDYASRMHLVTSTGESVGTKLVSISAVELPNEKQSGYIDFPVTQKTDLSNLKLEFDKTVFPLTVAQK